MTEPDLSRLRLESHEKELPRTSRGRRWMVASAIGIVVIVVSVVMLFALLRDTSSPAPAEATERSGQEATEPLAISGSSPVSAGGYIEARRTAILSPGRTGVIERIDVLLGQMVRTGDPLLQLEAGTERAAVAASEAALQRARAHQALVRVGPRAEQIASAAADVRAAEADLENARRNLTRFEDLAASGSVAAADLEDARLRERATAEKLLALRAQEQLLRSGSREEEIAEADAEVRQAQAAVAQARATYALSTMRAPFDGVVVRVDLEIGETVSLFGGLNRQDGIVLADVSELRVRVDVPEARIGSVRLGDRAEVAVDAQVDVRLEAEVVEIAPVADRQSNTVEVAVRILDPPPVLRPNMSARVTIQTRTGDDG